VFEGTPVQKHCVLHSSKHHINRQQTTTTLNVHFEYQAVITRSLLMLRKEFPWNDELMASLYCCIHITPRLAFVSKPKLLATREIYRF
jgi:hypothetical protein